MEPQEVPQAEVQTPPPEGISQPVPERSVSERREPLPAERLTALSVKQLKKLGRALSKVLTAEDAKAVHDVRVHTRRAQESLAMLLLDADNRQVRRLHRRLRRVRRAVGQWRDCDVALERLRILERRSRGADLQTCWALLRDSLTKRRANAINRARRKLRKFETLARDGVAAIFDEMKVGAGANATIWEGLRKAVADTAAKWNDALARAMENTSETERIHKFRIATKRLRYRIELVRDLGSETAKPVITWMKSVQDGLGKYRDRRQMQALIAEALANPDLLLSTPGSAIQLLKRVERERRAESAQVKELLRTASASPGRSHLDSWLDDLSRP